MASSEVPELEISDQDEDLGPESARVVAIQRRTEMLMAARERSGARAMLKANQAKPPPVFDRDLAGKGSDPDADPDHRPEQEAWPDLPHPAVIAKDLMVGVMEIPEAVLFNAPLEALADMVLTLNDLDEAAYRFADRHGIPIEKNAVADSIRKAAPGLMAPLTENEEVTVIGNMARDVANFGILMFGVAGKLRGTRAVMNMATKAPVATRMTVDALAGAAADFVSVDTADRELRALLDQYPVLQKPVLEFMAGDEDDTALDTRTKMALFGAPLGLSLDGFFVSLKALRTWNRSRVTVNRAAVAAAKEEGVLRPGGKPADEPVVQGPQLTESESSISGFGEDERLVRRRSGRAAEKLKKASDEVGDTLTPDDLSEQAAVARRAAVGEGDLPPGADPSLPVYSEARGAAHMPDPEDALTLWKIQEGVDPRLLDPRRVRAWKEMGLVEESADGSLRVTELGGDELQRWNDGAAYLPPSMVGDATPGPRAAEGGLRVEINVDRLDTVEDVEKLMQDATDLFADSVDTARRGKISNVATKEQASRLDIGIGDVLDRGVGKALNAAETTAFRQVWLGLAEKVEELARVARYSTNEVDQFRFRKALAAFNAVNQSVLGARAEAGRSLQAWRINVTGDTERAQVIAAMLENSGTAKVNAKLAEKFIDAIDQGHSVGQLNALAKRGWQARTMDMVRESVVVGLLWRPATQMVNVVANSIRIGLGIGEKAVAARIGNEMMTEGGVAIGEAMAQYRGTIAAIRSLYASGADAERLIEATQKSVAQSGQKIDVRMNAISAEGAGLKGDGALGKGVEVFGNLIRTPARWLEKADNLFKTVAYAGEVEAQAFRQATREGIEKGWDAKTTAMRMADLKNDPPEFIRLAGGNAALYSTFTQKPGEYAGVLFKVRDTVPGAFFVLPFIRTPMNVLRYDFEFSPLAPLVGQWRADVRAGGARRDIALARISSGVLATALMFDWAWEGHITGPLSSKPGIREAQQRQGLQPDSLYIGGHTVSLSRFDPWGLQLSAIGGLVWTLKNLQIEEEDFPEITELTSAISVSISRSILQKTTLTGLSRLTSLMEDPDRRGPKFLLDTLRMLFPFSSVARTAKQLIDPTRADVVDAGDVLQEMTVAFADKLPRARSLWGHVIEYDRVDIVNPYKVREIKPSPIDAEIVANNIDLRRISRIAPFDGVSVNFREFKEVYETYVMLAGHGMKIRGKGAEATLNALVHSSRYQKWSRTSEGRRAEEIRKVVRRFRKKAQDEIVRDPDGKYQSEEFRVFREYLKQRKAEDRELDRPSVENMSQ